MASGAGSRTDDGKVNVLFVCLGNICRSPLAEAVFLEIVNRNGLRSRFGTIDSCGTGAYHAGDPYDDRTIAICRKNKVPIDGVSRKLRSSDFFDFDYIFGMDASNVSNMRRIEPKNARAKIHLFGDFDDGKPIQDPYYGGDHGFTAAHKQCVRYAQSFLKELGMDVQQV